MKRLEKHLKHIENEVVPGRGAAQQGLAPDYAAALEERLQPPLLVRGIEQWNEGQFYEQHETLEFLWRATDEPVRDAFKGIIQSGVGAYHVLNRNRRGALGKWTGALGYLAPFQSTRPYGIDTDGLRAQVAAAREALLADGDETDWDGHEERARELLIEWERRPAEPVVTAALGYIDRSWHHPRTGLEAALRALAPAVAEWVHPVTKESASGWALWAAGEKAQALNAVFGVEKEALEPGAEWRLAERWMEEVHQALRAAVGFTRDAEWRPEQAEEVSRLMLADEYAATEIVKMAALLNG